MKDSRRRYAVVDLFAGPGGLGEGFAAFRGPEGSAPFQTVLSVDADRHAHQTLLLRSFLRKFDNGYPDEYYQYINGELAEPNWEELAPDEWRQAVDETKCLELGTTQASEFLAERIGSIRSDWDDRTVLIGGPPCQAYSVVGRSRNARRKDHLKTDPRYGLYRQYIEVLAELRPAVAVMENVKGILSASLDGNHVFPVVLAGLRYPRNDTTYRTYNNGITATAEEVELEGNDGRLLLHRMKNFQIVNGGQTTASLHVAYRGRHGRRKSEADLSRTCVQVKLTVVDRERAAELVPKISEYANTQNRVSAADFFSNHPFHVRLESFSRRIYAPSPEGTFQQSKWFYERARGQYADARAQRLTTAQRRKFDLENPRRQLFTKTDLAKFCGVWEARPHTVSLGAQKNFADFAGRVGKAWEKDDTQFNEAWFREVVAKAITFRRTEKIVSAQDWYEGGYRANIVAYAIAKLAHDVEAKKRAVDFEAIWRRQALTEAMEDALALAAREANQALIDPLPGIRNVTEWAKKQPCWKRVRSLAITWPSPFLEELISAEDQNAAARSAKRSQRELNGLEAQIAVVEAGPNLWTDALQWGDSRRLLSPKERAVLQVATRVPEQMPSDKQSLLVLETLRRLKTEGFPRQLPVPAD